MSLHSPSVTYGKPGMSLHSLSVTIFLPHFLCVQNPPHGINKTRAAEQRIAVLPHGIMHFSSITALDLCFLFLALFGKLQTLEEVSKPEAEKSGDAKGRKSG